MAARVHRPQMAVAFSAHGTARQRCNLGEPLQQLHIEVACSQRLV
jgi:hypothetical protein